MGEPRATRAFEDIAAELRRLGLDPDELTGLAIAGPDVGQFLAHLRGLPPGTTWSGVFPGTPLESRLNAALPSAALGAFDYVEPPRGAAVFASIMSDTPASEAARALAVVEDLGLPIFGSGPVLDRGSPHLYVVLKLGASEDQLEEVVECLRKQPGVANAYQVRSENPPG